MSAAKTTAVGRAACAWALAASLSACGSPPAPPERVEVGTSVAGAFVPFEGATGRVELVLGPQLGFHVDTAVRVWADALEGLRVTYQVLDAATGEALGEPTLTTTRPSNFVAEGDHFVLVNHRAVLATMTASDVTGRRVTITARVERSGQAGVQDAREATVVDER